VYFLPPILAGLLEEVCRNKESKPTTLLKLGKISNLGTQLIWDKDYKNKNGGTGKTSLTSLITLMAKII
jgi:hypothetical protein